MIDTTSDASNILTYLHRMYGPAAEFRDGQQEAIQTVLSGQRVLVVQKTGWGKSLIYFLATKVLRERGNGPTIIISPILALMNDQIAAAEKWGLRARTINSTNKDAWSDIEADIFRDKLDVLFIAPERLANQGFTENVLNRIQGNIGMLVIDEAHCISDWGHDFRPDYRRIIRIIKLLPPNVPLLATTATANDRVIDDIKEQMGDQLLILRGSLSRESLYIQIIRLINKEERLAWILQHINELPGTGLIYCLTKRDCKTVAAWLNSHQVKASIYHGDLSAEERFELEQNFNNGNMKVLVATVAFGMGIDKPDIAFVIHFQKPGNVVAYYQQIGRAGRNIDKAYAVLLVGREDDHINQYFINTAFPSAQELDIIIEVLTNSNGLSESRLMEAVNMNRNRLEKALKYLLINGDIFFEDKRYYKSPKKWTPDYQYSAQISEIRANELKQMNEFIQTDGCLMNYITTVLNDPMTAVCGHCGNCKPQYRLDEQVSRKFAEEAQRFLKNEGHIIEVRKQWPVGVKVAGKAAIPEAYRYQLGCVLSNYGDDGWGQIVAKNKYVDNRFSEELIEASYESIRDKCHDWNITWITSVPSLRRPNLVRDFAIALAKKLKIPYCDSITKIKNTEEQKKQNNSYWQYKNANDSFGVAAVRAGNVLLVDDMVDSRWTLTVCAYKLRAEGSGEVYPFALANTGNS